MSRGSGKFDAAHYSKWRTRKDESIVKIVFLLISIFTLFLTSGEVSAESTELSDQTLYESELFVEAVDWEYTGAGALESITISKNGQYALCLSDAGTHHVNLYDSSCKFLRQFIFNESGALQIFFDDGDGKLVVLPVRKRIQIKIDGNGNYISSAKIDNLSELVTATGALKAFQVSYGENTYTYKGKKLFSPDSQVFRVTDGDDNLLFEYVPTNSHLDIVLTIIWIILALVYLFWVLFIRKRREK